MPTSPTPGPLRRKVSLRRQSAVLLIGVLAATTAIVTLVGSALLARYVRSELERRGGAIVALFQKDADLRVALSLRDAGRARTLLQAYAAVDPDVRFLALLDPEKKPIAWVPEALDEPQLRRELNGGGDLLRFVQPVKTSAATDAEFALAGDAAAGDPSTVVGHLALGLSDTRAALRLRTLTLMTVLLAGALLFAAFQFFFARVQRRINRLTGFAEQLAAGDLRGRVDDRGPDELGRLGAALVELADRSQAMVTRMQEASGALASRSDQLLETARSGAAHASGQAASVGQMGAAVAQLRSGYQQALARAQEVMELARHSDESSRQGRTAVEQSVGEMQAVREQVARIGGAMQAVVERTAEIGTITRAVRDIADQTSVLALNAGIEAARAGEQGRGFAVVAQEEHKLAEESKAATARVRVMLRDIEQSIRAAVAVVQEGQRTAARGMSVAHGSGEAISRLAEAIQVSSRAAQDIADAMNQQFSGVEQIFDATRSIEESSAQAARSIQMLQGAASEARAMAASMRELVARYQV